MNKKQFPKNDFFNKIYIGESYGFGHYKAQLLYITRFNIGFLLCNFV